MFFACLGEVTDSEMIDGVVGFFADVLGVFDIGICGTVDADVWLVGVEKGIYCFIISNVEVVSIDADEGVVGSIEALEFCGEHPVGAGEEDFHRLIDGIN
jgi:hypothetical protein